jgi:transcriptional regulator with XRE-family HTH domain
MNTLAARLRAARLSRGWTIHEVEDRAGVTVLAAIESGQSCPHPRTVRKVAAALGVSRAELLELDGIAQNMTNERMRAEMARRREARA